MGDVAVAAMDVLKLPNQLLASRLLPLVKKRKERSYWPTKTLNYVHDFIRHNNHDSQQHLEMMPLLVCFDRQCYMHTMLKMGIRSARPAQLDVLGPTDKGGGMQCNTGR